MPFFSDSGPRGFEPKRTHRWTVSFKSLGEELTFMATKVKKPSFEATAKNHQFMNHIFKYPGIVKWADIDVSFIDAFEPNVGSVFYNVLLNSGYEIPDSFTNSLVGLTKTAAVNTIGDVVIRQLDGGSVIDGVAIGPNIREEWTLKNAFMTKASWSTEMQYNEDAGMVEVGCTLSYDYATYVTSDAVNGLGQYV